MKTIRVIEAAANNLPDEVAVKATRQILDFCATLTEDDVLFVLITGGGSALLPLPVAGISLQEKLNVIQQLVRKGATINELNQVRIQLSAVKGGKLAEAAAGARKVISLIISDIVDDPMELIASGPTVRDTNNHGNAAVDILKAHDLWVTLSDNVQRAILQARANTKAVGDDNDNKSCNNVENILIANNKQAVDGCLHEIAKEGVVGGGGEVVQGWYLSNSIVGDVGAVAKGYFDLGKRIKEAMESEIEVRKEDLTDCLKVLGITDEEALVNGINKALEAGGDLCLVAGGETTVQIRGQGLGGRNQQMVAEFMRWCEVAQRGGVYLLSAGTDGIDGPTDAAGALGSLEILREQFGEEETKQRLEDVIENNDSYNWFRGKNCHVVIGHTGTNVMDIQLLLICRSN